MVFAHSRYQLGALCCPKWRQTPLDGIRMTGAVVKSLQFMAGPGPLKPGAEGGIPSPHGWTS